MTVVIKLVQGVKDTTLILHNVIQVQFNSTRLFINVVNSKKIFPIYTVKDFNIYDYD